MGKAVSSEEGFAKRSCDHARKGGRSFYRNLLTENCSDGKFKAVPAAGDTEPWFCLHLRCQFRVVPKTICDGRPVRIEIKHSANALDNQIETVWVTEPQANH